MNSKARTINWMLSILLLLVCSCIEEIPEVQNDTDPLDNYIDWSIYRGDKKSNQYSELAQIHAGNVHKLELEWTYSTGDATRNSSMQVNPIIVDGLMYVSTPSLNAVALDAVTGEEVWVFKSFMHNEDKKVLKGRTRGSYLLGFKKMVETNVFFFL